MIRTIYINLENIVELQVELCFFSSTMIGTIHDSSNIVQLYRTIVLLYRNYDSSYTPVLMDGTIKVTCYIMKYVYICLYTCGQTYVFVSPLVLSCSIPQIIICTI